MLCLTSARLAADDPVVALAEVKLKDGRTLHSVKIVGYARSVVTARWDGGRGTIAYDAFPPEVEATLESHRPPPQSEESVIKGETAAKELAERQHAAELKRRADAAMTSGKAAESNAPGKGGLTVEDAKRAVEAHNVIPGLNREQVSQAWGQPALRYPARAHALEKWSYPDHSSSVVFDKDGFVSSVVSLE